VEKLALTREKENIGKEIERCQDKMKEIETAYQGLYNQTIF
jgi:hypothetical protein